MLNLLTDPQNLADAGVERFPRLLLLPSIRQPMVSTRYEKHFKLTVWPAAGQFQGVAS